MFMGYVMCGVQLFLSFELSISTEMLTDNFEPCKSIHEKIRNVGYQSVAKSQCYVGTIVLTMKSCRYVGSTVLTQGVR